MKLFAHPLTILVGGGRLMSLAAYALAAVLAGCAAPAPVEQVEETPELVWPTPPQQAVIRFVEVVTEIEDLGIKQKSSFKDLLVGSEPEEKAKTLEKPFGVLGDDRGRLFVTDTQLGALIVFDREANRIERWGEFGMGQLSVPMGMAMGSDGRLYVCDQLARKVVVFETNGSYALTIGDVDQFENPVAVAVNDDMDRVYVVDSKKHQVLVFNRNGEYQFAFGEKGNLPGYFTFPTAIAVGSGGRLFVSDAMNFRVQILDADGAPLTSFGELGQRLGDLNRPKGIALDRDGHVYVVDASFANVQMFAEDGSLLMWFGDGGSRPGQFLLPAGIDIDGRGRIFVADQMNHRVQIFEYLGAPEVAPGAAPEKQ